MTQQRRAQHTRKRIFELAAEEIAAHGYARTNLQTVAERLNMTKGALYGHFASKEALADALEREAVEGWRVLRAASEASGATAEQVLGDLMPVLVRQLSEPRTRAAVRLAADSGRRGRATPNFLEEVRACLLERLREARDDGHLVPQWQPESAAQILLALVYGATFAGWPAIGQESQARRLEVVRVFLDSLRVHDPEPVDEPDREGSPGG